LETTPPMLVPPGESQTEWRVGCGRRKPGTLRKRLYGRTSFGQRTIKKRIGEIGKALGRRPRAVGENKEGASFFQGLVGMHGTGKDGRGKGIEGHSKSADKTQNRHRKARNFSQGEKRHKKQTLRGALGEEISKGQDCRKESTEKKIKAKNLMRGRSYSVVEKKLEKGVPTGLFTQSRKKPRRRTQQAA